MPDDKRHVGAKAQRQAIAQLMANHMDEYQKLLGDEREKLGLPREPKPPKKLSKYEQLRQQVREAGMEPVV